jgi:hypothetical protein
MLILDCTTIIKHQYLEIDASRRSFHRLAWLDLFRFFKKKAIGQLNKTLSSQFILSRGFVSEFTDIFRDEVQIDLSSPIGLIQDLIVKNLEILD